MKKYNKEVKMKIKSITKKPNSEVFDISVDEYENYVLENGVITHNSGLKYSASTILYISKANEKGEPKGYSVILKFKTFKSRLSKENQEVSVRLYYDDRGLDRYYGLVELGEESGIIPRVGNRYEINGKKIGRNVIYANPEEYFTPELLEKLDEYAQKKFKYGSSFGEVSEYDLESEE